MAGSGHRDDKGYELLEVAFSVSVFIQCFRDFVHNLLLLDFLREKRSCPTCLKMDGDEDLGTVLCLLGCLPVGVGVSQGQCCPYACSHVVPAQECALRSLLAYLALTHHGCPWPVPLPWPLACPRGFREGQNVAQWFKQASRTDQGWLRRGHVVVVSGGQSHWPVGRTYLQEVRELLLEELLEFRLAQSVFVTLPSRILVEDVRRVTMAFSSSDIWKPVGRLLMLPA